MPLANSTPTRLSDDARRLLYQYFPDASQIVEPERGCGQIYLLLHPDPDHEDAPYRQLVGTSRLPAPDVQNALQRAGVIASFRTIWTDEGEARRERDALEINISRLNCNVTQAAEKLDRLTRALHESCGVRDLTPRNFRRQVIVGYDGRPVAVEGQVISATERFRQKRVASESGNDPNLGR